MKCRTCSVDKLSKEFPRQKISEHCNHPRQHCMRCVVAHVKQYNTCPHPDCDEDVDDDCLEIRILEKTLDEMFRVYDTTEAAVAVSDNPASGVVKISVLNGDSVLLPFNPTWNVLKLKQEIQERLKYETGKQKLLYGAEELKTFGKNKEAMYLSDYNVRSNSVIHLVILMMAIPEGFNRVVFDLNWGFPIVGGNRKQDYLNASCLMFSHTSYVDVADFRHRFSLNCSVRHSGDEMDRFSKRGHHKIEVHLKDIPDHITHLFFTLSAWRQPTLANYPDTSLKFYEADRPSVDLCKPFFTHVKHHRAVVMCSLSRSDSGSWKVFENGKVSGGDVHRYDQMKDTIRSLISEGI